MIDWKDPETLHNLSPAQALVVLGQISAALANPESTETMDAADRRVLSLVSDESQQFADACNRLGRKMRAAHDCRPELRIAAEEKREETRQVMDEQRKSPEEEARAYADTMKAWHRKK
jgi:hypothetical protein